MENMLKTAIESVRAAAGICTQVQAQLVSEDTLVKKDRSPVTVADFASQALICTALKENFPQISIVGEEDAADLRQAENSELLEKINGFLADWTQEEVLNGIDYGNGEPEEEFWTLDPIDGTKGFLRGQQYAMALALIRNGKPVLGVLGCPNLGENGTLMYAIQGEGAFSADLYSDDFKQVQVARGGSDAPVRFLESVESGHSDHGLQGVIKGAFGDRAQSVRYDSQVKYAVLSRGEADVYLRLPNPSSPDYREKIWDHAAGAIIVQEAGGTVTDIAGNDLDFSAGKKLINNRGVVVTNGPLHDEIIALIQNNK